MKPAEQATKVVIVTSVMLSFVSFWRAAAIVLNDLGLSAYYVGGMASKRWDVRPPGSSSV